jgi:hypothetical protein
LPSFAARSYSMEPKMHLLPPQVELDLTCLILTLATLAIAWLTCCLPTRDTARSNATKAALRSRAAGPSRALGRFSDTHSRRDGKIAR